MDGCETPLGGVSKGIPPLIYIGGSHGAFDRGLSLYPLEPTLGDSEELPRVMAEAVGPMGQVGRPGRSVGLSEAPTAPKLDIWAVLVSLVLSPWGMAYPTLVCWGIWACFDPFQPQSHAQIGCAFCFELRSEFPYS